MEELKPLRPKRKQRSSLERDEHGRKECIRCREWLPEDMFNPHPRASDGKTVHCRPCIYFLGKARRNSLTPEALQEFLDTHGPGCNICGHIPGDGSMALALDHDHSCCAPEGTTCGSCLRGLLCGNCNTGLGSFMDSPDLLLRAINYLKRLNS